MLIAKITKSRKEYFQILVKQISIKKFPINLYLHVKNMKDI